MPLSKLLAVETLGSVNVICSDKTGTLTQNEMTVTQLYAANQIYEVTGVGYAPEGTIVPAGATAAATANVMDSPVLQRLLEIGTLCNDASLQKNEDGTYQMIGDPTEGAMLTVAAKVGITPAGLTEDRTLQGEMPFDSDRKMMTVFYHGMDSDLLALTKGAPDIILSRCVAEMTPDGEVPLTDARREEILTQNTGFARQALRVLAFAYSHHDTADVDAAEQNMVFVGLMGMIDPPRPEVRDSIALCHRAGIRTVMITGDHKDTAGAIAADLGMLEEGDGVMSGVELDALSDEELREVVEHTVVYARVSPEHKVRIVAALRANGHIVSMTGDGVNDAPALKQADIGVAMGITGTEVAKNTAEMILTDDNYTTIVRAVAEGRVIYSNIRKFISFLLSCNIGEILVIFITSLILGPSFIPLTPIQLLWLNLVTDSLPALALGQEKAERDIMDRKPRKRSEKIINKEMGLQMLVRRSLFWCGLCSLQIGINRYPNLAGTGPSNGARTYAFVALICAELFRAYSSRSEHYSVFSIGLFSNRFMIRATLISLAMLLVVLYVPFLEPIFDTVFLGIADWGILLLLALIPFAAGEVFKLIYHRKTRRKHADSV